MDGFEVLERLKANDGLQHVPVIMISALSETESVARCVEMGAEDYLTKPFNVILLRARLHACLEKKRGHDREVRLFEQLQQNYDRLQELETLRDDLTHMIVHDLRTPLTSVIAAMQTLEVLGEVNAGQREIVDIAVTESGVLLNMINSLLDVEKLESGTMALECSLFAPRELIASALAQVTPLAQEKAIALVQDLSAELPLIEGDEIKLQRVLVNLLGNALKFTPAGGTVSLRARQSDDKSAIEFFVKDTGEGIPLESFDRIFQKFGQVESRKAGRSMSTGLGLTFCKLAVEAHGGEIGVESMLGQGSTFWFTVPWASFRPEDSSILLPPDARSFRP
jgi:signal transduction histidine kinase